MVLEPRSPLWQARNPDGASRLAYNGLPFYATLCGQAAYGNVTAMAVGTGPTGPQGLYYPLCFMAEAQDCMPLGPWRLSTTLPAVVALLPGLGQLPALCGWICEVLFAGTPLSSDLFFLPTQWAQLPARSYDSGKASFGALEYQSELWLFVCLFRGRVYLCSTG